MIGGPDSVIIWWPMGMGLNKTVRDGGHGI